MNLSHPWSWYKNGEGVRWKLDRQIHRIREVVLKTRIGAFGFAQHTDIGTLSMLTASCPVTQSLRWSFLKSVDSSKRSELESICLATLEFRIEVLPTQNFPFRVVIEGNFFFLTPWFTGPSWAYSSWKASCLQHHNGPAPIRPLGCCITLVETRELVIFLVLKSLMDF